MPARKPTRLKVIAGTARPDRTNPREPAPPPVVEVPTPPESLDDIGAREWRRLASVLVEQRVLTTADTGTLERCCAMYSRAVRADRALLELGSDTFETRSRDGAVMFRVRPEVRVSTDAWRGYQQAASLLGCTPVDRQRVSAAPALSDDKGFA